MSLKRDHDATILNGDAQVMYTQLSGFITQGKSTHTSKSDIIELLKDYMQSESEKDTKNHINEYLKQLKVKRDSKYVKERDILSTKVKGANLNSEQKAFRIKWFNATALELEAHSNFLKLCQQDMVFLLSLSPKANPHFEYEEMVLKAIRDMNEDKDGGFSLPNDSQEVDLR